MLAWDLDINNPPVTKLHWLRLIARKPRLIRRYPHWLKSLAPGADTLNDETPRFACEAIDWLESYLEPSMHVFEWGSGGSTLFLAHRVGRVFSLEHDLEWYLTMTQTIARRNIRNAKLMLQEPNTVVLNNEMYSSIDERYSGLQFLRYAQAIDSCPDSSFDLICVDGRARTACMRHAMAKVRPGGYLLLDNSERERYLPGKRLLQGWKEQIFYGVTPFSARCSATTIWQKPVFGQDRRSSQVGTLDVNLSAFELDRCFASPQVARPKDQDFQLEITPYFLDHHGTDYTSMFTTALLANLLTNARLFIDTRAHEGFYPLLASTRHNHLEVIALEPAQEHFTVLMRNIERNAAKNIRTIQRAAWGTADDIEMLTIDAVLKDHAPCRTIIRVSADGYELQVLNGMRDTLARFPDLSLIMELKPAVLQRNGNTLDQVLKNLHQLEFDTYFLDERQHLATKITDQMSMDPCLGLGEHINVYCPKRRNSMSFCFFSYSATLGGAASSLLELVTELIQDHGCICTVVLPEKGALGSDLLKVGAACVYAPYSWWCDVVLISADQSSRRILDSILALFDGPLKTIAYINPDIVVTFTMVIPWGAVTSALLGKPHVWHICEFGDGFHFFYTFEKVLEIIRDSSTALMTNSNAVRHVLFPRMSEEECITLYRHIPIPAARSCESKTSWYTKPRGARFGIFAAVYEGKGQEDAVRAVAELIHIGHDIELVIAGTIVDHEYKVKLEDLISRHTITNKVSFLGWVQDVYSLMRETDIVIICTRNEAFGRVAVEAMLLGKPVIYPSSGAFPEYMVDGETGLAYAPGDWGDLAKKMETLLLSPELGRALASRGKAYAQQRFTRQEYGAKFFQAVNRLRGAMPPSLAGILWTQILTSLIERMTMSEKERQQELARIQKTLGWKVLRIYWQAVEVAFRPGTIRRRVYDDIFNICKSNKNGPTGIG